jgi:tRNA (cmo5U34)-methyltransferase
MKKSKLEIPTDWTFKNVNVAENFTAHVNEQLPWYSLATGIISHFGRHYLPEKGVMYDVGASTGNVTRSLQKEITARNVDAISIDYSEEMRNNWSGVGKFYVADAREYEFKNYDLCVCFLVLMFLSPVEQQKLVARLVQHINVGGALVIFDKTEAVGGYLGTVLSRLTLAGKLANGASPDDIVKKELSLAGAQRPIIPTALLTRHGSTEIFRFGEFAGWVITN